MPVTILYCFRKSLKSNLAAEGKKRQSVIRDKMPKIRSCFREIVAFGYRKGTHCMLL